MACGRSGCRCLHLAACRLLCFRRAGNSLGNLGTQGTGCSAAARRGTCGVGGKPATAYEAWKSRDRHTGGAGRLRGEGASLHLHDLAQQRLRQVEVALAVLFFAAHRLQAALPNARCGQWSGSKKRRAAGGTSTSPREGQALRSGMGGAAPRLARALDPPLAEQAHQLNFHHARQAGWRSRRVHLRVGQLRRAQAREPRLRLAPWWRAERPEGRCGGEHRCGCWMGGRRARQARAGSLEWPDRKMASSAARSMTAYSGSEKTSASGVIALDTCAGHTSVGELAATRGVRGAGAGGAPAKQRGVKAWQETKPDSAGPNVRAALEGGGAQEGLRESQQSDGAAERWRRAVLAAASNVPSRSSISPAVSTPVGLIMVELSSSSAFSCGRRIADCRPAGRAAVGFTGSSGSASAGGQLASTFLEF